MLNKTYLRKSINEDFKFLMYKTGNLFLPKY